MEKLEATFRIVTPMFIGGADQTPDDGIRPPSVKGALRFWWRALNWGRFYKQEQDETNALKALHKEEGRLFGLSAKTKKGKPLGGQGTFLMTVRHNEPKKTEEDTVHTSFKPTRQKTNQHGNRMPDENHLAAARYLGYGLITAFTSVNRNTGEIKRKAGQLERGCLNENQIFTVTLAFRKQVDESVLAALKMFGLLGGLGSRSRHGMGSIALEKMVCDKKEEKETWTAPTTQEKYQSEVKQLLLNLSDVPQPEYSAFSKESRVDYLLSESSPYKVLDEFGLRMLDYRSWGKTKTNPRRSNILPSGKKSEMRFKDDHHWFRKVPPFRSKYPNFHPERIVFGLPHNYDSNENKVNAATHERRASPLFFHVHRLSDKNYIGVSVFLKSPFLPNGEKINAGGNHVDLNINAWKVITNFLDGKIGIPETKKDRFPDRKEVLP